MDCLTYHYDVGRLGNAHTAPVDAHWFRYFLVNLGSAVRGAPLVVNGWKFHHGPHTAKTHNLVIVATSDNRVLAYAEEGLRMGDATALWSQNLGPAVMEPGSNIPNPIGVCSTPVLDPPSRRMFVMSAEADGAAGGRGQYRIYSLDLDSGAVLFSALLQDSGAGGRPTFDGHLLDQRAALNLVGDRVYSGFAAYKSRDAESYHGWVVGCHANNLNDQWFFPMTRSVSPLWNAIYGGGIWGPGGVAAAPDGTLYVGTGNGKYGPDNSGIQWDTWYANYWSAIPPGGPGARGDYFIAVLKLGVTRRGRSGSLTPLGWYHPPDVKAQDRNDKDFGSSSPLILPDIAGMQMLVISPKNGIYLLDRASMTALWSQENVFSDESHSAPAYYLTPAGEHRVYCVGSGLPGLICYRVDATGMTAQLTEIWRANIDAGDSHGSPTIGVYGSGAAVWIVQYQGGAPPGILRAYDAMTGTELYNSTMSAADDLGDVPHYAPITALGSSVFVGNASGFACYGPPAVKVPKELEPEIQENKIEKI